MQQVKQRLEYLFERYLSDGLTDTQRAEFLELVRGHEQEEMIKNLLSGEIEKADSTEAFDKILSQKRAEEIFGKVIENRHPLPVFPMQERVYRIQWTRWAAAAVILILFGAGIGYYVNRPEKSKPVAVATEDRFKYDVPAGTISAKLTLSDGTIINLDSAANGNIRHEGNTRIIKLDDRIAYKNTGGLAAVLYNTISTARGNQYMVILPDDSKVWLNAESAITFPTTFNGDERIVKVTGEAYFEVAKMKNMPFKVAFAGDGEIEVLGTHFNISSYTDDPVIKTTLLEGSVRISKDGQKEFLKPGEQADIKENHPIKILKEADVDAAIAWKNGFFSFKNADIKTVMLQLMRWYNLDIRYEGPVGKQLFTGEIDRTLSLVSVLKILEKTKAHFRTEENNRLVILP